MEAKKIKIDKIDWYVVCLILCSLIIIFSLVGRRSFNKTYDAYVEASINFDGDTVYDLLHESYIERYISRQYDSSDTDFLSNSTRAYYENLKRYTDEDCIENGRYTVELRSIEDCDLNGTTYDTLQLQDYLGDESQKVQAAKYVKINFVENYSNGDSKIKYTEYVYFVKINNSWYLAHLPFMPKI